MVCLINFDISLVLIDQHPDCSVVSFGEDVELEVFKYIDFLEITLKLHKTKKRAVVISTYYISEP